MINKGMMSSNTGEWATPQAFYDAFNAEFNFTVDVCATRENAKCNAFYDKSIDGLSTVPTRKSCGQRMKALVLRRAR
ncbi:MAG: DNA N-6-adenine-methyltransferase [Elusimicrobiota bacterium]